MLASLNTGLTTPSEDHLAVYQRHTQAIREMHREMHEDAESWMSQAFKPDGVMLVEEWCEVVTSRLDPALARKYRIP